MNAVLMILCFAVPGAFYALGYMIGRSYRNRDYLRGYRRGRKG